MFAIRHKKVPNVWLGHKYYKRGNDYYPIAMELNPSSLKDIDSLYLEDGEFFNDTDYNENTLIDIIDTHLNVYHRMGVLPEPCFIPEDWEVVKLSVSVEPIDV